MQRRDHLVLLSLYVSMFASLVGCGENKPAAGSNGSTAEPAAAANNSETPANKKLTLAMIPKGTQASFWNSVHRGAEKAQQEFNVDVIWKGPVKDNDRASQKQVMEQFLDNSADAILLAPTDSRALASVARTAMEKSIPVFVFDSALEGEAGRDFVSMVATDNEAAGKLGGKHLMSLVGDKGKVILFRHMEGHASTSARESGALAEMEAGHGEILEKDRYSGESASEAQTTALNMIDAIRAAGGIFASNQTSSEGLLLALRQTNLAGKVKFVGFDSSPMLVEALRKGEIDALVVQDPVQMGYQCVKSAVEHLQGKKAEPRVDMAAHLVTRENMDEPQISALFD